ncbi:MAG: TRAP transporter fused permease subunit [Rhodobacteraceae bacterium]|nr:TRAP transporter fused permease subunit [Paracoccaceae bacterium]
MSDAAASRWTTGRNLAAGIFGFALAATALYTAGIGSIEEYWHRSGVLWLACIAVVLSQPLALGRTGPLRLVAIAADLVLVGAFSAAIYWFLHLSAALWSGLYLLSSTDILLATTGLVALLELTRRAFGWPLAVLAGLALLYALGGQSLPGILRHAGYSPQAVAQTVWYSLSGVFGVAASVMVTLVFVYIVFGAVLEGTGAGAQMLRVATRATGGLAGGPAHAAVGASALFGTISGSVTANVVGTGVFTMSMMKRRGFAPGFAGGVEAAASSAGQFLPPVMGAAAFLMSELVGISYLSIALAALLPALLFFGGLFAAVAIEARKLGMKPVPRAEREHLTRSDLVASLLFVLPIGTVVAVLVMGRSPAMAGFVAIIVGVLAGLVLNAELRAQPWRIIVALSRGGIAGARIMVAVGAIGVLIGVLNLTGLGMRLSQLIISGGGGLLMPSLLATMLASLVLGMGLPTLPAYLIIVILVGPVLQALGAPLLAAHLFVMYFGVFSALTPPVALAAFAAAPIVQADPLDISLRAMRLSLPGFVIPYVFVTQPELLIVFADSWVDVVWVVIRLVLAIWMITTALAAFDHRRLGAASVLLRLAAALALVTIWLPVQLLGLLVASGIVLISLRQARWQ